MLLLMRLRCGGLSGIMAETRKEVARAWQRNRVAAKVDGHFPEAVIQFHCVIVLIATYGWQHGIQGRKPF